jgi:hypothetical protein
VTHRCLTQLCAGFFLSGEKEHGRDRESGQRRGVPAPFHPFPLNTTADVHLRMSHVMTTLPAPPVAKRARRKPRLSPPPPRAPAPSPPPRLPLLPEVINQSRSISPLLSPGGPDPLSSAQMNMGGSGQRRGACGSANEHADRSLEMSRRARNGASSVANTLNRHTLCDWDRQAHLLLPESESPEVSFELSAGATCSY